MSEHGLRDLNALMQHAKDLKRLASEASSKIEKKTNFDEATKLRGMIMSLGLVSRHTFIFCIEIHVETQIYRMRTLSTHFRLVSALKWTKLIRLAH